jgi:hypothetical protein
MHCKRRPADKAAALMGDNGMSPLCKLILRQNFAAERRRYTQEII